MCKDCSNWHNKFPDHKKHTVLSINELSNPEGQAKIKSRLYCKKHQDKTLKFYCETCKVKNTSVSNFLLQKHRQGSGVTRAPAVNK